MLMLYIWLSILALGLIIELIVEGSLITIWFSIGSIIPMLMAIPGDMSVGMICAQIIVFGVVSAICLIFLRKLAKKFLFRNTKETTNMDSYIGKIVKIIKISDDSEVGIFKLNGVEYEAIFENESDEFVQDEKVKINKFKGNKAIVSKKGE